MDFPISEYNFFLFTIPGAITVWSYRTATKSNKSGDFEYLALSVFWGIAIFALNILFIPKSTGILLQNMYAAALVLSLVAGSLAYMIGKIIIGLPFNKISNDAKD